MTSLISDLQPSNQPVLSNKPLNNLQSGISLQRAAVVISTSSANSSNCPCTTLKNQTYINQDFTNTAFINLTMISGGFTACDLTLTNFTKSVLASYSFLRCTGYSPMFYQVTLSDASFVGCTMTNASWAGQRCKKFPAVVPFSAAMGKTMRILVTRLWIILRRIPLLNSTFARSLVLRWKVSTSRGRPCKIASLAIPNSTMRVFRQWIWIIHRFITRHWVASVSQTVRRYPVSIF